MGFQGFTLYKLRSQQRIDHLQNWSSFYSGTVVRWGFHLPQQAQPVKAEETRVFMGMNYVVRFKLPASLPPEKWADSIAQKSKLTVRKSAFVYETVENRRKLEYLPQEDQYEISWGF